MAPHRGTSDGPKTPDRAAERGSTAVLCNRSEGRRGNPEMKFAAFSKYKRVL